MKELFICFSVIGMILIGCTKHDDEDNSNSNGNEKPNKPELPDLPVLPDPDDVCSAMDDLNFMSYCYENFDVNKDSKVSINEANAVREIAVNNKQIKSLKGIERFPNLTILNCSSNKLKELDVRYNTELTTLVCSSNIIEQLNVSYNLNLETINCSSNPISELDFQDNTKLSSLNCSETSIISIDMSNMNLLTIDDSAFKNCAKLTSVFLPRKISTIKNNAFEGCNNLTITAPGHIETIEQYAFGSGPNLTFYNDVKTVGGFGHSQIKSVVFPEGTEIIESGAFDYCQYLQEIVFSESIKIIGYCEEGAMSSGDSFNGCSSLTKVEFPKNTEYIEGFSNCKKLSSVSFGENLTEIHGFDKCSSLENISLPHKLKTIDGFSETKLTEIVFPNGIETISGFDDIQITDISFPETVKSISGFNNNPNIRNITLPKYLERVSRFGNGTAIKTIKFPEGVRSVSACDDCPLLETVYFPDGVEFLGGFKNCPKLTRIDLPKGLKTISGAFTKCTGLTEIIIPQGVEYIYDDSFSDCTELMKVTLFEGLKRVGYNSGYNNRCFNDCKKLVNIVFPQGVTCVFGFFRCAALKNITFPNTVTEIGGFTDCENLATLILPASLKELASSSFAFINSYGSTLQSVVCHASIPPICGYYYVTGAGGGIEGMPFEGTNATLYVPSANIGAYKVAEGWKYFRPILPITE